LILNFKKKLLKFGTNLVLTSLFQVADVLSMAVGSLEKDAAKDKALKSVYDGISMTETSLLKAFAKHGLVQIRPEGQKFDPNLHEAVFEVPEEQVNLTWNF
jgi:molecular chaperone GrpE